MRLYLYLFLAGMGVSVAVGGYLMLVHYRNLVTEVEQLRVDAEFWEDAWREDSIAWERHRAEYETAADERRSLDEAINRIPPSDCLDRVHYPEFLERMRAQP